MKTKKKSKLSKLYDQYKQGIWAWIIIGFAPIILSLVIHYFFDGQIKERSFLEKLADFLITMGEAILGAGLIGGGIGGVINFIFEELKKEDDERKERIKEWQENREKNKSFRQEVLSKLQHAHDNVELARVLIKSHKSGKTYGEQIRSKILPSLISLLDIKRGLVNIEDKNLKEKIAYLQVSLDYMIAYLSVLMAEFEYNYLSISNLQNYQDAMTNKIRTLFIDEITNEIKNSEKAKKKELFLEKAKNKLSNAEIPSQYRVVWEAIEKLDYIWDFTGELRDNTGTLSLYNQFFLDHYKHCKQILVTGDCRINEKIISKINYLKIMKAFEQLNEMKSKEMVYTKQDDLIQKIMEIELRFNFETAKRKPVFKA